MQTSLVDAIVASPNNPIEILVRFRNIGLAPVESVKIVIEIPSGLGVVPGSVTLVNGNYPAGFVFPPSAVQADGRQINIDIGNYNGGIDGYVRASLSLVVDDAPCMPAELTIVAFANPAGRGSINDSAAVATDVPAATECVEPD